MIDVGANVGDYTALAATVVGPSGHVYAVEPGPDNLAKLHERFHSLSHVSVVAGAVSDRSGTMTFFLDRRESTRHSLAANNVGKAGESITVRLVALDEFCDRVSHLDVLKIDAQGAELNIIRGAQRLLARFRPAIVVELWPGGLERLGGSADLLLQTLRDSGYTIYRLSAKGQLKPERFVHEFLLHSDRRSNCINIVAVWRPPASFVQRLSNRFGVLCRLAARLKAASSTRSRRAGLQL